MTRTDTNTAATVSNATLGLENASDEDIALINHSLARDRRMAALLEELAIEARENENFVIDFMAD